MSGDRITSVIKTPQGNPIGTIVIHEDGSFEGHFFKETSFIEVFTDCVRVGFVNGLILMPEMIPASPKAEPCRYAFSHANGKCIHSGCKEV